MSFRETVHEAWQLRFGTEPPVDTPTPLLNHRSVRDFTDQEIDEATLAQLIGTAQSASSSSNLQLYTIISADGPELRRELAIACADQKQIHSCARFLVFCADTFRLREGATATEYAETFILAAIDAAIAAERLVCAAELQGLGICYIGALRNQPERVAELLNLPHGVFGLFGLCLGYPQSPPIEQIKPRLSPRALWFREGYNAEADLSDTNDRMRAFYESQGMKGEHSWSQRSSRRLGVEYMSGREKLKSILEERGFWRK